MSVNSIYKLLDKLEMMILKGAPVPFSPFVMVNHEKVIDILDKVRASIPGEIQEAHGIIRKSEEIQIESQRKAEMFLSQAKTEAERILSESELLKAVQAEADKIREEVISEAEAIKAQAREDAEQIKMSITEEARAIKQGADNYAENVLTTLDNNLSEMHAIVKNGQLHLESARTESDASFQENEEQIVEPKREKRPLSYKIKK